MADKIMRTSLRFKIVNSILIGIFLVGIIAVLLAREILFKTFTEELHKNSTVITEYISEKMIQPLLNNDLPAIKLIFYNMEEKNKDIIYIFVVDPDGKIMISTIDNDKSFEIAKANKIPYNREYNIKRFRTKQMGFYDVGHLLLKSRIGELHIGFSDEKLKNTLNNFNKMFILIISPILFSIVILGWYGAKTLITDPLEILVNNMQEVRQGNLDRRVDIGKLPNDEMMSLGQTFNYMSQSLQDREQSLILKQNELSDNNKYLEYIVHEIQHLLENAIEQKSFKVRFHNPDIERCWEIKGCNNTKCPAYGNTDQRCWHIAGTFCKKKVQGIFAQKLKDCKECEVYQKAISTRLYTIGEIFNNMMELLEEKNLQLQGYADNLEKKVKERTNELEKANKELKITHVQLVQSSKMAAVGQLASGVAHEINNPLTIILNNVRLINMYLKPEKGLTEDDFKESLSMIESATLRAVNIVKTLLDFSHISKGEFKIISIDDLIENVLILIGHEMKYSHIVINRESEGGLPKILGDSQLLQQVFLNLISNAKWAIEEKSSKEGGTITIKTKYNKDENSICVLVQDSGIGISKENQKRLFEPFFTTKDVGKGTGLGLSIVYNIVVGKYKGKIDIESEKDKGATFKITLPIS